MGDRVLLDPALAPALAAAGLASADGLFRLGGDPDATSLVTTLDLPLAGTSGHFHLKRYRYPGWRKSWGLLGRGTLWGRPPEINEFRALAEMRQKGVPAARPVAAASRTRRGRLVAHALVTEHVPDTIDLARRLGAAGDPVRDDPAVRRRVLERLARALYRLHAEGLVHRDPHARNVLVRVEEDDARVWLVDCRRGGPPSWRWNAWKDLATVDLDLAGRIPASDRLRALRAWTGPGAGLTKAHERVRRLAAKLARRA